MSCQAPFFVFEYSLFIVSLCDKCVNVCLYSMFNIIVHAELLCVYDACHMVIDEEAPHQPGGGSLRSLLS